MQAAGAGHADVVNALLQSSADVKAEGANGGTALMSAAQAGHADVVNALLEGGADVNATMSIIGVTALMLAAGAGHADVVNALLQSGADLNAKNVEGGTALMAAAVGGHADVVNALLEGEGVTRDIAHAANLFQQACDGGGASGCYTLGVMHENGEGVTRDLARAASLYEQACDGGVASGCYNLGLLYYRGEGVTRDLARAASLHQQACDGGEASGCYTLGFLYQRGEGVTRDLARANALFQQACDAGNARGCEAVVVDLTAVVDSTKVFAEAVVDVIPERLSCPNPQYPREMSQANIEGEVLLQFVVETDGRVKRQTIEVVRSTHWAFDAPAKAMIAACIFRPGMVRTTPVRVLVQMPLIFALH